MSNRLCSTRVTPVLFNTRVLSYALKCAEHDILLNCGRLMEFECRPFRASTTPEFAMQHLGVYAVRCLEKKTGRVIV